mmetsp:Transcript_43473/g.134275  ORF Transcript_43473/g.134275 Transcript_43473/m.134275 type:complete len:257 (-) Transcript_43473:166-936(-)
MIQYGGLAASSKPTMSTPWSSWPAGQLVITPPMYVCHVDASTASDSGPPVITQAAICVSFFGMFLKEEILAPKSRLAMLHAGTMPSPDTYGYDASVTMLPCVLPSSHVNALSMRPPSQPWSMVSHDTSSCSDSDVSVLPARNHWPSMPPVVENDQHEPHWPWFLTGVTAPCWRQSCDWPAAAFTCSCETVTVSSGARCALAYAASPLWRFLNSASLMSANSLTPNLAFGFTSWSSRALRMFSAKILKRRASSASDA